MPAPPFPAQTPHLPVVQFGPDDGHPQLLVYNSLPDLQRAIPRPEFPTGDLFDVRGVAVNRPNADCAQPAQGDPVTVQRRLVDEVRRVMLVEGTAAADAERILTWLGTAPSLAFAVSGLGLIEPDYGDDQSRHCVEGCSGLRKAAHPGHCC